MHLLPLTGNFSHTVVVGAIQVLHLTHQIIPFNSQTVKTYLDVVAVSLVVCILALERFNLFLDFKNAVVCVENFGLEGFDHAHFALEVLGNFFVAHHEAVSFSLEHPQIVDCVRPAPLDISQSDLCVSVLFLERVQLKLQVSIDSVINVFVSKHATELCDILLCHFEFLREIASVTVYSVKLLKH